MSTVFPKKTVSIRQKSKKLQQLSFCDFLKINGRQNIHRGYKKISNVISGGAINLKQAQNQANITLKYFLRHFVIYMTNITFKPFCH